MKRIVWLCLLIAGLWAIVMGGGFTTVTKSVSNTFTFLGGDSTNHIYTDTFYYELPDDFSGYRFLKVYYQCDVAWGDMSNGTSFVDLQTGTGSREGYWTTLTTWTITDDSLITTSGYDLVYALLADSVENHLRLRIRMQTDSSGNADLTDFIDSTWTMTDYIQVMARD